MSMKLFHSKYLLVLLLTVFSCSIFAQESHYDRRIHRYRKHWEAMIPTQSTVQMYGNMGLVSIGMGWDYGHKKQWETDLLFGLLPPYSSGKTHLTMTLKQNFIPWSLSLNSTWAIEPLSCGIYLNTVYGPEFWTRQPERYPKGYYTFPSRVRANVYIGQRVVIHTPVEKRWFAKEIAVFYELSTSDLYLASAVGNKYLKPRDYISLSFGLKFQLF